VQGERCRSRRSGRACASCARAADDRWLVDPRGFWSLHVGTLEAGRAPSTRRSLRGDRPLSSSRRAAAPAQRLRFAREILALAEDRRSRGAVIRAAEGQRVALLRITRRDVGELARGSPRAYGATSWPLLWPPDWTIGELWPGASAGREATGPASRCRRGGLCWRAQEKFAGGTRSGSAAGSGRRGAGWFSGRAPVAGLRRPGRSRSAAVEAERPGPSSCESAPARGPRRVRRASIVAMESGLRMQSRVDAPRRFAEARIAPDRVSGACRGAGPVERARAKLAEASQLDLDHVGAAYFRRRAPGHRGEPRPGGEAGLRVPGLRVVAGERANPRAGP
jgi:hypothetical protein